jgi:hypothetical protein
MNVLQVPAAVCCCLAVIDPSMHSMPAITPNPAGTAIICQSLDNQVGGASRWGVWWFVRHVYVGTCWNTICHMVCPFVRLVILNALHGCALAFSIAQGVG